MNTTVTLLFWLIVCLTPAVQTPKSKPTLPVNATGRAEWLIGCWQSGGPRASTTYESWSRAGADMLVATSIKSASAVPAEYTFLRIESTADWAAQLITQNAGERPVRFTLDPSSSLNELIFRSADRSISYQRGKDKTLVLRVAAEGASPSETPMKKADCR